jgi:hypothetical protein
VEFHDNWPHGRYLNRISNLTPVKNKSEDLMLYPSLQILQKDTSWHICWVYLGKSPRFISTTPEEGKNWQFYTQHNAMVSKVVIYVYFVSPLPCMNVKLSAYILSSAEFNI